MQTVTIPQGFKPFKVTINYKDYEFEPGKEYTVADDVYEQIKRYIAGMELPEGIIGDPFASYDVVIRCDAPASPKELPKFTLLKGSYKLAKNRIKNKVPVSMLVYFMRREDGETAELDIYKGVAIDELTAVTGPDYEKIEFGSTEIGDVVWAPATETEPEKITARPS
jgi:hypothetical protein